MNTRNYLHPLARIFWFIVNAAIGLAPSLAFFIWVERNASLPVIPLELGWPWIDWNTAPLLVLVLWDMSLFLLFGFFHSLLAQPAAHQVLRRVIPPQAIRSFYIAVTGALLFLIMATWQHTGRVIWVLSVSPTAIQWLSIILFWSLLSVALGLLIRFEPLAFLGLEQLYSSKRNLSRTEGTGTLLIDGIFQYVRHPVYLATVLAFLVTPFMTLDRLILSLALILYLILGIPIEERKLVAEYGDAYLKYRQRVPGLIPFLASNRKMCKL